MPEGVTSHFRWEWSRKASLACDETLLGKNEPVTWRSWEELSRDRKWHQTQASRKQLAWDVQDLKEGAGIQCLRNGDIYPQTGCVFLGNRYLYSVIVQIFIKHLLHSQVLRIQQSTK